MIECVVADRGDGDFCQTARGFASGSSDVRAQYRQRNAAQERYKWLLHEFLNNPLPSQEATSGTRRKRRCTRSSISAETSQSKSLRSRLMSSFARSRSGARISATEISGSSTGLSRLVILQTPFQKKSFFSDGGQDEARRRQRDCRLCHHENKAENSADGN